MSPTIKRIGKVVVSADSITIEGWDTEGLTAPDLQDWAIRWAAWRLQEPDLNRRGPR